ncbi:hypothetical protein CCACVL1_25349, partial [Corchorus capsularis]
TQCRVVKTSKLNAQKFTLTTSEEAQVRYLEKYPYKLRDLVEAARLVLYGINPEPYKMKGIKKQKCSARVCTQLTIHEEVEKNGEKLDVPRRAIVVKKGGSQSCLLPQDSAECAPPKYRVDKWVRPVSQPVGRGADRGEYNMNPTRLAATQKRLEEQMVAVKTMLAAEANFLKYEKEIRAAVLGIGNFIDKNKPGASISQVNKLKDDLLSAQAQLVSIKGKLKITELDLKDAKKKANNKDDLLRKQTKARVKAEKKLQINNLNAELDAIYEDTVRQVLRARASVIYMIQQHKGIED